MSFYCAIIHAYLLLPGLWSSSFDTPLSSWRWLYPTSWTPLQSLPELNSFAQQGRTHGQPIHTKHTYVVFLRYSCMGLALMGETATDQDMYVYLRSWSSSWSAVGSQSIFSFVSNHVCSSRAHLQLLDEVSALPSHSGAWWGFSHWIHHHLLLEELLDTDVHSCLLLCTCGLANCSFC